jgi:RNA polymerase sigma factor (sigma-70 family)
MPDASKDHSESGFETLMQRISEGAELAVWELLDRYQSNILRVVRRHLPTAIRGKVDSVDIVQSVWRSLLRKEGFDQIETVEQFIGYAAGVAKNKVFETHRHFTRIAKSDVRREVPLDGAQLDDDERNSDPIRDPRSCDPRDIAGAKESWNLALQNAGERGQLMIKLRLQGLTYDQIATETGLSFITVRRTLSSILNSLTA